MDPTLGMPYRQPVRRPTLPSASAVLTLVGWGRGCELGIVGHMSSDRWARVWWVSFLAPPRSSLGLAKATCHIAMPSCPTGLHQGPGWPPAAPACALTHQGEKAWGLTASGRAGSGDRCLSLPLTLGFSTSF